jgi:PAS domain S-box-containing protein
MNQQAKLEVNYTVEDIAERRQAEELIYAQRDLGMALTVARGLDTTLRLCLEAALRVSNMDCGGIYLFDDDSGDMDLAFHIGLPDDFVASASHFSADSPNVRLVLNGKPIYTHHKKLGIPLDETRRRERLRAIGVIPVRHEDRVIACLNVASHTLDDISGHASVALETIATQIGGALARAKAEDELLRYRIRLEELVDERTAELQAANEELQGEIIERKRAEEAERENAARFRSLFEDSPISLWEEDFSAVKQLLDDLRASGVADLRSHFEDHPEMLADCARAVKITGVNQATLDLFRAWNTPELLENLEEVLTPQSSTVFREELIAFAQGDKQFSREAIQQTLDGETLWTIVTASIAPGYEESWAKVFVSVLDITDRRRSEQALQKSEARFRAIFESSPLGIVVAGRNSRLVEINSAFCAMLGYGPSELLGQDMAQLTHPDDLSEAVALMRRVVSQEIPSFSLEQRLLKKTGDFIWCLVSGTMLFDADGQPSLGLAVVADISDRKNAEEQLRRTMTELERFNRLAVGREQRMIELKREVNLLSGRIGDEPPYDLSFLEK